MSAASMPPVRVNAPMRLFFSFGLGAAAWALCAFVPYPATWQTLPWELRALVGWLVSAGTYLISSWRLIYSVNGDWIRQVAQQEDNGKRASGLIAVATSIISLAGVMFALSKAGSLKNQPLQAELLIGAGLLSVALSWLVIQTVYLFRYAHLYYETPEGGVQFPGTPEPDYLDFAYLSFTIGMTYQVSDTDLDQRPMRRLLTGHSLISYVYGVVIIALAISAVSSVLS
ncbi:DUF1345 domain-containing protein [Deinococcus psychrotolerans]|uniref:DUF1345 domain-containing protein n=1 Tax=Deinococcus psychrotolerans TaxID=2489213 RepID=A0A3G8YDR2_9DEIO|nr:DUF1345 domain-containing protein [Deinococcus psychrotolerans]AZI43462.1 DUF1345 domain-containing protein [Deinococcus psychrotolerans]